MIHKDPDGWLITVSNVGEIRKFEKDIVKDKIINFNDKVPAGVKMNDLKELLIEKVGIVEYNTNFKKMKKQELWNELSKQSLFISLDIIQNQK